MYFVYGSWNTIECIANVNIHSLSGLVKNKFSNYYYILYGRIHVINIGLRDKLTLY